MNSPTEKDPIIVYSKKDYIKFAEKFIIKRDGRYTGLGGMTETAYLAHIRKFWGEPPSYPAMVWTGEVEPSEEEIGPCWTETVVHWETKAELSRRLAKFH